MKSDEEQAKRIEAEQKALRLERKVTNLTMLLVIVGYGFLVDEFVDEENLTVEQVIELLRVEIGEER